MRTRKILLAHGSGGRLTHDLIRGTFLEKFKSPILHRLADSAVIDYKERVAFTTDSFVVSPLFFPGGDIGKLCVTGSINDLVMVGAKPEYLSLGLIMEEGLDRKILERVIDSVAFNAKSGRVSIVTGDTKVVEKGAADKLFINTAAIGRLVSGKELALKNISCGDKVIITGSIAEHGLAVLAKRRDLDLGFNIKSDCASLASMIIPLFRKTGAIKFMRDPTRGGLATTLNEICSGTDLGIIIEEKNIPLAGRVRAACELLGIDPLYVANEGKAVLIADCREADKVVKLLAKHPLGRKARVIGTVVKEPHKQLVLRTAFGTERILDMLSAEPLPRIC